LSQRLHKLIKTLTPNEKGHLKKTVLASSKTKVNLYGILFDIYDQLDIYSDEQIKTNSKKKKLSLNLNQAKIYLENLIVKEFQNLLPKPPNVEKIENAIAKSNLYYKKGMYDEALKILEKIEPLALKSFDHLLIQQVLYPQIKLFYGTADVEMKEKCAQKVEQLKQALSYGNDLYECADIFYKLLAEMQLSEAKSDYTSRQLQMTEAYSNLKLREQKCLSPQAKIFLKQSALALSNQIDKEDNVEREVFELLSLFEVHKDLKHQNTVDYLVELYHAAEIYSEQKNLNGLQEIKAKVKALKTKDNNARGMVLFTDFYLFSAQLELGEIEIDTAIVSLKNYELQLEQLGRYLSPGGQLYIKYKLILLYFILQQYDLSLKIANNVMNNNPKHLRQEMLSFINVMFILNHYAIKNYDVLPYYIKQAYRFFLKIDNQKPYYKWTLKTLRDINKIPANAFTQKQFKKILSSYHQLEKDGHVEDTDFDFGIWLQSIIYKKPYLELLVNRNELVKKTA